MSVDGAELQILRAVQALEEKLTTALNRQTATLTQSIQKLASQHAESLLNQEKRNATFADRDRVEAVAEHGHATANAVTAVLLRVSSTEARTLELSAELQACKQSIADRTERLLGSATGYLLTFLILLIVAIASALIARAVK